jgi:hypothetical protein
VAPRLADYLEAAARSRPAHCGAFLCGWVRLVTGQPVAAWADGLTTSQWAREVARRGGLVRVVSEEAAALSSVAVTIDPQPGDVGVVMAATCLRRGRVRPVCAIKTGKGWAVFGSGAVMAAPVDAVRAWRLPNG